MYKYLCKPVFLIILFFCPAYSFTQNLLAFPGAEGYGKYTVGGRGGAVYEVTNLNDAGEGSLRAAVEASGPRTIVFRVSGTIDLKSDLKISNPYITIAGQTAPGDGICIKRYPLIIGASQVIIRHIRVRFGDESGDASDAISSRYTKHIIIDHVSASWSVDETMSIYHCDSITVQWCLIAESMSNSKHEKGAHGFGGIWGSNHGTYHHNLLAHHSSRNPRFASGSGNTDYRNNVLYNWGYQSCYGGEMVQKGSSEFVFSNFNMVANYYKPGPATQPGEVSHRIASPSTRDGAADYGKWYVADNVVEGNAAVTADNWNGGVQPQGGSSDIAGLKLDQPWPSMAINQYTAEEAYYVVLKNAGATLPKRDAVDARIVDETRNGYATYEGATYKKEHSVPDESKKSGMIDSQADVGGWPRLKSTTAPTDTDHDGMPNEWEKRNGLDPNNAADRNNVAADGYTMLEKYLNITDGATITGELKKWHAVILTFDGPECSETDEYNPFFNYRLNVIFTHRQTRRSYTVPGYFAADGNAGMTSASSGNKWRVHFTPDHTGVWDYLVDFKKGKWAAVRVRTEGVPSGEYMDGETGEISIDATDKSGRDFRAHGRLQYVGERYLRFAESGKYFYKCGPDAPENFLAYTGFDGNFASDGHKDDLVKTWEPHHKDWKEGNPQWPGNRGKEIIGALNYLASEGMNAVSFLTNNIAGDDQNVFPYIDYDTYDRFDCSKLDQWEMVFNHAQTLGLFLHFKTLEAENQGLLDNGGIGGYTRLYYRELIARFGHHLALNWNLGEEIGDWSNFNNQKTLPLNTTERQSLAQYIYDTDPYHHHMVIHNGEWFTSLYGDRSKLTGASLQTNKRDFSRVNSQVKRVIDEAKLVGKVWAVACDEPGDASHALITDSEDPEHFEARTNGLWGAMLAGGWGTEWYFGYQHPHSDLTCQDYRSRDLFWDMGRICINFFTENEFPVTEMASKNELISSEGDFCFAKEGDTYIILLKKGGESQLNLENYEGDYTIKWLDPRNGGDLQNGSVKTLKGSGSMSLGLAPNNPEKDWVVLVRRNG